MGPELEILQDVLNGIGSTLIRDFRNVSSQKNQSDRIKSIASLRTKLTSDFSHQMTTLTRSDVGNNVRDGWFFEPLDGVDNFSCGIPVFSAYACLINDYRPVGFGLIYPSMQQKFLVSPKSGLNLFKFREEGLMKVTNTSDPALAKIVTNISGVEANLHCPSLAYTYTAAGRFDGFILELGDLECQIAEFVMSEACGVTSKVGKYLVGSNQILHESICTRANEICMKYVEK